MKPRINAFPSPKQDRAATLLAAGNSVKDTAAQTGAGLRTIYEWLDNPEFTRLINRYRQRLITETLGLLAAVATKAVATLEDALDCDSPSVRVRAALGILDQFMKLRDATELVDRVAELEKRQAQSKLQGD